MAASDILLMGLGELKTRADNLISEATIMAK
ncbi:hypothetical protein SAL_1146 [Streptococcus agalactiae 515]|nr:hypothetical protein SAL_1146 [Streptococcus agalactiae 515]